MFQAFDADVTTIPVEALASPSEMKGRCTGLGHGHRRVDLVGDHGHAVPVRESRDRLELVAPERGSGGVVRVAEEVRPRAAGERLLEPLEVELPASLARRERHLDDATPDLARDREERRVDRRIDHHCVSRLRQRAQQLGDRRHHVGDEPDTIRIDVPGKARGGEPGERAAELRRVGVARVVVGDRGEERLADREGEREVGLGDPGREHVARVLRPLGAVAQPEELERDVVEGVDLAGAVERCAVRHGR